MAIKAPLVLTNGQVEQLQAGDSITGAAVTMYPLTLSVTHGFYYRTTITNAAVSPSSNIMVSFGDYPDTSDNVPDPTLSINTIPGTGQFGLIVEATNGQKFGGTFIFNYIIG